MPVTWTGWVFMAWGPFFCLFSVSCIHSKVPAISYLMACLPFLLCGSVIFFRVYIFRILAPHEDLGTLFLFRKWLFCPQWTNCTGLRQATKQSNNPFPRNALLDMLLIDNLWGGSNSCRLWLECLGCLKTWVSCFYWEVLDRQCPFSCQKLLNINLRACPEGSRFGRCSCCLAGSDPSVCYTKWDTKHSHSPCCVLVDGHVWLRAELGHQAVREMAGLEAIPAHHSPCPYRASLPLPDGSPRQISCNFSGWANRSSSRANWSYSF